VNQIIFFIGILLLNSCAVVKSSQKSSFPQPPEWVYEGIWEGENGIFITGVGRSQDSSQADSLAQARARAKLCLLQNLFYSRGIRLRIDRSWVTRRYIEYQDESWIYHVLVYAPKKLFTKQEPKAD